MNLDWSTFLLEIINFLVLVWILKRFLYKPVLDVIERRKAGIAKTLSDARAIRDGAEALKRQYNDKLSALEREKERVRAALQTELQAERERRMAALRATLDEERKKHEVLEARRQREHTRRIEQDAVVHGARFAARLLGRIASPEVEARLADLFLEELARQPEERTQAVRHAVQGSDEPITISSAYPLAPDRRAVVTDALGKWLGRQVACRFSEDGAQLAGLRVTIGPWILEADLQHELRLFTESTRDER
ncbi:MAG TPA: F0F1 ATP synthase subunit delta [Nitrospiria bacterium]|nr:F0F1 ATP synthase subunit delta [Nitrospiria bacterium]